MLEQIISALVAAGVRFVVLGGVAATIHGSARLTNDLDICYDTRYDNIRALIGLVRGWDAYLRGVGPGLPFPRPNTARADRSQKSRAAPVRSVVRCSAPGRPQSMVRARPLVSILGCMDTPRHASTGRSGNLARARLSAFARAAGRWA